MVSTVSINDSRLALLPARREAHALACNWVCIITLRSEYAPGRGWPPHRLNVQQSPRHMALAILHTGIHVGIVL